MPTQSISPWRMVVSTVLSLLRLIDYGLRDYGTAEWVGGDAECDHLPPNQPGPNAVVGNTVSLLGRTPYKDVCLKCGAIRVDKQIGLEPTPDEYVAGMVQVFRELWRVLRDDGTFWLNIGDSYAGSGNGSNDYREAGASISKNDNKYKGQKPITPQGYKAKDLMFIPARVAMALQADGWWVRSDIVWWKKNCTPESVKDRPTSAHEFVFLMTKSRRYWYDHEAVKTPTKGNEHDKRARVSRKRFPTDKVNGIRATGYYPMANLRNVWHIPVVPYHGAHYATFPPDLVKPCILAGCPEGGLVLDPFAGSGTTLMVARKHRRDAIGLDLNFNYLTTNARERLQYGSFVPVAEGVNQLTIY